jgi:hypothetical protein
MSSNKFVVRNDDFNTNNYNRGKNSLFAANVCRNCGARFTCDSYRTYSADSRRNSENFFRHYLNDYGTGLDQQERLSSGLESAADVEDLE